MNAVRRLVALLSREELVRLAELRVGRFEAATAVLERPREVALDELVAYVAGRYEDDLGELLNACGRDALDQLAIAVRVPVAPSVGEARRGLWRWGAAYEAGSAALIGTAVQPEPSILAGQLTVLAPPRGLYPAASSLPRPMPPPAPPAPPIEEPETVDDLLAAATGAIGVRLGQRHRDKGAWGVRAAQLLGVPERGADEPDWRGDVEIKTVPVALTEEGLWRVVEDPAICMAEDPADLGAPVRKLRRVLWLCRADAEEHDATILSWYFLEWDETVAALVARYLHQRPKGPKGTTQRGWYLHKRFFVECGLLATLNAAGAR